PPTFYTMKINNCIGSALSRIAVAQRATLDPKRFRCVFIIEKVTRLEYWRKRKRRNSRSPAIRNRRERERKLREPKPLMERLRIRKRNERSLMRNRLVKMLVLN